MASKEWLKTACFYQVYPPSFCDSNGDGIGDLNGITEKLDHIQWLGCTAIWLNPCFESPFGDGGYDISDYRAIAKRYGSLRDFRRLVNAIHQRKMRLCLDLVPGHTSVEHPWFQQSCQQTQNPYTNRYIWNQNTWIQENDGYKYIQGYGERDGCYQTNFFWFQPALNYGWANPDPDKPWQLGVDHPDVQAVRRNLIDTMRYWLEQGVDCFRVDMAASLIKQDTDYKHTRALWKYVRKTLQKDYPEMALLSEWSHPVHAIASGFDVDFLIHVVTPAYTSLFRKEPQRDCFNLKEEKYFSRFFRPQYHQGYRLDDRNSFFDRRGKGDITAFVNTYRTFFEATKNKGFISIPSGNHDISRLAVDREPADLEVIFAFLMTMPGLPCIYYGDEIGMRYVHGLSKEGGYGRTGSRTPMQWNSGKNAGFSTALEKQLYLPLDAMWRKINVEHQQKNADSLLCKVRNMLAVRNSNACLCGNAAFVPLYAEPCRCPFVYLRKERKERVIVAINPSAQPCQVQVSLASAGRRLECLYASGCQMQINQKNCNIVMQGVSYGVYKVIS